MRSSARSRILNMFTIARVGRHGEAFWHENRIRGFRQVGM
jgi:hypothetical protein